MKKKELIFCPLGGSGEIGMNMNLFAYGNEDDKKWIGKGTVSTDIKIDIDGISESINNYIFQVQESTIKQNITILDFCEKSLSC